MAFGFYFLLIRQNSPKSHYNTKKIMNAINGLPVYKWVIDDTEEIDGVSCISLVDDPAVEKSFAKYSKEKRLFSVNEEKHVVTGVAIRADFPIYRNEKGKEFYAVFDKQLIEKLVHKFMKEKRLTSVNVNHDTPTDKVYLFESFILREKDPVGYPELKGVEPGSWIVSYKVECPELWKQVKSGDLTGFSIEMYGALTEFRSHTTKELIDIHNAINAMNNANG